MFPLGILRRVQRLLSFFHAIFVMCPENFLYARISLMIFNNTSVKYSIQDFFIQYVKVQSYFLHYNSKKNFVFKIIFQIMVCISCLVRDHKIVQLQKKYICFFPFLSSPPNIWHFGLNYWLKPAFSKFYIISSIHLAEYLRACPKNLQKKCSRPTAMLVQLLDH